MAHSLNEDILHDGRKWGFNDTVVRERIGVVAKRLGLDVFN